MTDQSFPITPPPEELRRQWQSECPFFVISVQREDWMIDRAAQWGADQELEACCEWLKDPCAADMPSLAKDLQYSRRPKLPSLKEEALKRLKALEKLAEACGHSSDDTIRLALEALPND